MPNTLFKLDKVGCFGGGEGGETEKKKLRPMKRNTITSEGARATNAAKGLIQLQETNQICRSNNDGEPTMTLSKKHR